MAVHCDMAFDSRNFLARVIILQARRVRTLRVDDQEREACVAPLCLAGHANLIFKAHSTGSRFCAQVQHRTEHFERRER